MRYCVIFALVCCVGVGGAKASSPDLCRALFGKKSYARAAGCFRALRQKQEASGSRNPVILSQIVRFGRNEALCLRKVARQTKNAIHAAHYFERALQVIRGLLVGKYYRDAAEKRFLTHIAGNIEQKVGYVRVTITTGSAKATMSLTGGYRFAGRQSKGALWQTRLRIGTYTLLLGYPGQAPLAKQLTVEAGKPSASFNFRPPASRPAPRRRVASNRPLPAPPAKKPPILGLVLVGVGGAMAALGGVLLGAGVLTQTNNNKEAAAARAKILDRMTISPEQTQKYTATHEAASTQILLSGIGGGLGLGVAILGVILIANGR